MIEYGAKALTPPDWLAKNAIYQINPRTFGKEGTLKAITARLPELKRIGFDIIYVCPVFEADDSDDRAFWSVRQKKSKTNNPKNPYRMNNYFRVDCEYGNDNDLRELVDTAHALSQRVILDLVYMHIGPNAPIVKRHPEFVIKDENGVPILTKYNFYTLDFKNAGLCEYLWCNMVYYVSEYDVDGFRCDVGDAVPLDFWAEGRRRIQAIKPECVLINEGRNLDCLARAFDCMYNFTWHEILYRIISGEADVDELIARHRFETDNTPSGGMLMRDMDNHDTVTDWPERAEKRAGHDGMELITVLNYIIDGVPMVYSGNELADTSFHSMFASRFFPGAYEVTDRDTLYSQPYARRRLDIVKQLNALKKSSDILRYGKTVWIDGGFYREYKEQRITMLFNMSTSSLNITSPHGQVLFENGNDKNTLAPYGYIVVKG